MRILHRLPLATVAVVVGLLTAPAAASADVSCRFASAVLTVELSAPTERVFLTVSPAGGILVTNGGFDRYPCAGPLPTVTNANTVAVQNQRGMRRSALWIQRANAFVPGAGVVNEGGGDPEIEFSVNFNDDPESEVIVETDEAGGSVRFGDGGINPNATSAEVIPDTDITLVSARYVTALGGSGPDTLGAQGGAGTGGPLIEPMFLYGGLGPDDLTGGAGPDGLRGGGGNDRLSGLGGDDSLTPDTGDDTLDGGPGSDTVSYSLNPAGVAVDLSIPGPQLKGPGFGTDVITRVENAGGSGFADVLRGDSGPNRLSGFEETTSSRDGAVATDSAAAAAPTRSTPATAAPTTPTAGPRPTA